MATYIKESELRTKIRDVIGNWHNMQDEQSEIAFNAFCRCAVPSNYDRLQIGSDYQFLYFWELIPLLSEFVTNHVDHTDLYILKGQ